MTETDDLKKQNESRAARDMRAALFAEEFLKNARAELMLSLPFLSEALARFAFRDSRELVFPGSEKGDGRTLKIDSSDELKAAGGKSEEYSEIRRPVRFGTDGRILYYDPWHVLAIARTEDHALTRDLLHTVLHFLFRHPFADERKVLPGNREIWDFSCDIAVEHVISSLGERTFSSAREKKQEALIGNLLQEIGEPLSADRIYRYLKENAGGQERPGVRYLQENATGQEERLTFLGDQHRLWYRSRDGEVLYTEPSEDEWERLVKKTELLAEETEEDPDSPILKNLKQMRERRVSYAELLRRFLNRGEILRAADEFDYVYYTYGLSLYGNIPLIEPLEYREDDRIRTIAVALDTSGSVQGRPLERFLEETGKLLFDEALVSDRMRIRILQCDDRIREDVLITDREELLEYLKTWTVKGKGQTDFRPVFSYLTELVEAGELQDFQGLLYYTDGQGIFPAEAPPFETMFLFSGDGAAAPAWAAAERLAIE